MKIDKDIELKKGILNELANRVSSLKSEREALEVSNRNIEEEKVTLAANFEKYRNEVESMGSKAEEMVKQKNGLEVLTNELEAKRGELNQAVEALKDEKATLEAVVANMHSEKDQWALQHESERVALEEKNKLADETLKQLECYREEIVLKENVLNKREALLNLREKAK